MKEVKDVTSILNGKRHWIAHPYGIVCLRGATAPLLFYTFIRDLKLWTIGLFLFACSTDALDGHLVKRLGISSSSSLEAYFDPITDFLLVLTAFSAFVVRNIYPFWVLILLGIMFFQFLLTSGRRRPLYDPVGKYYGAFLFATIGITLAFPNPLVYDLMFLGILGATGASVTSRSIFLFRRWKNVQIHANHSP